MPIFLAHVILLAAVSFATTQRLFSSRLYQLIGMALLFWGNIVTTCLALSLLGQLHDFAWLLRGSLLLATAGAILVRWLPKPKEPLLTDTSAPDLRLILGAGITIILITLGNLSIASTYAPSNYDSLTYHLPRSVYYLGQGSLKQFATADFRQVYYPYNFNLLQLLCFSYKTPPQALTFFNVAAWVLTGLGVYRSTRLAGCSSNASLVAAWFALTMMEVLAQATSTILDLPCGAALISGVAFALRWNHTRQRRDALLAGLGISMCLGTKLTAIFFLPAFCWLLLVFGWRHFRSDQTSEFFKGVGHWILPALLSIPLGASFIFYNFAASRELMTSRMDFTLNKPFEFGCVLHTTKAYLVQIFAEPFARLTFNIDQITRFNQWFATYVFADWNPRYVFSPLYTVPPDLNEDHVFFGFAGPLFLICAVLCVWRDRRLHHAVTWTAFAGLGWFAAYFAYNKWSLYNQRYFIPPMVLLAPSLALVLDRGWHGIGFGYKFKRLVFMATAAIAAWCAGYYLLRNTIRPVPLPGVSRPHTVPDLPSLLADRLSTQTWINVDSYGTNERIYPIMEAEHGKRFTSGPEINPNRFHLFSFWKATRNCIYSNLEYPASYTLIPFPGKRTAGVEYIGTIEEKLADSFDYVGLPPQANASPATAANSNILVIVEYSTDATDPIRLEKGRIRIVGLNPRDHSIARISTESADGSREEILRTDHHDWNRISVKHPFKRLVVEILDQADGRLLTEGELPFTVRQSDVVGKPLLSRNTLFSAELVNGEPVLPLKYTGLASQEGPYPQWDLPIIRWAKQPVVRITIPANPKLRTLRLSFSTRLQMREESVLEIHHNGETVQRYGLQGSSIWLDRVVDVPASPGVNVIEFVDRSGGDVPDWLAYLDLNPDVKKYVLSTGQSPEASAQQHYDSNGRAEGRYLPMRAGNADVRPPPESLYYVYRSLRVDGMSGQ